MSEASPGLLLLACRVVAITEKREAGTKPAELSLQEIEIVEDFTKYLFQ